MKSLIKGVFKLTEGSFRVVYFLIAIFIIFLISYFLGFQYLQGIIGNDGMFHLSNIYWIDKFFPNVPYWYPLQNGGIVPVWGYPQLSYFAVVIIHRLSSLNLVGAFQVLGFLSIPLTSLGLYLFVWTRFKNQTMAGIAAILYPLMPLSWIWLFDWGFYGESVSYIFIFPTLIFYDIFLDKYLKKNFGLVSRLAFLLTVLFLGVTFLAHPTTFLDLLFIIFFLTLVQAIEKKVWKIKNLAKNIFPSIAVIIFAFLIISFLFLDFKAYSTVVATPGAYLKQEFLEGYTLNVNSILGIGKIPITDAKYTIRNAVVPLTIWIPAILGLIAAIVLKKKKMLVLGLLASIPFIYLKYPLLTWYTSVIIPYSGQLLHHRAILIFIRAFAPIVAAFGIVSLSQMIFDLPLSFLKKGKIFIVRKIFVALASSFLAIVLTLFLIIYFANKPSSLWKEYEVRYGPNGFDIRNPFLDNNKTFKNDEADVKQVKSYLKDKNNWPRPKLANNPDDLLPFPDFVNAHKNEKMLRVDLSPYLGGEVMRLNIKSDISQINLYAIQLSLLGPYWGIEQQALFTENTGNTINVNNIVKWFGIKYLFFNNTVDKLDKYKEDQKNWKEIDKAGIWQFADPTEMYSWTVQKPASLVIGSLKKRAFEPLFRVAINGGIPYEDNWLVQGKENVDDYSLSELKKFDSLILYGYSYKDRNNAFKMLDQYVKEGGNLYISTGWQYTDRDWKSDKTPDFFPVEYLVWSSDYDQNLPLEIENKEIAGNIDIGEFSPLKWNNLPWGVSISTTNLRSWAKPVLSLNEKPLIAGGTYGKGRVVWSGLDLIGHVSTYEYNKEEMLFINNLFKWLNSSRIDDEKLQTQKLTIRRDNPDKVEFTFNDSTSNNSTLFWRETQFPNWKATLITPKGDSTDIKIYKGGPGFMLMRLPAVNNGSKLTLEFKTGFRTFAGRLISIITLFTLLAYLIMGSKFTNIIFRPFKSVIKRAKNLLYRSKKELINRSDEEETY